MQTTLPRSIAWPKLVLATLGAACLMLIASPALAQYSLRAPVRDPAYFTQNYVWSYKDIKEYQVVMQKRDYSCGAAALATVVRYYWGDDVTEEQFLDLLPKLKLTEAQMKDRVENGLTLTDLRDMANLAKYDATMGKLEFNKLAESKVPLVVGLIVNGHEHFAVYRGTAAGWVYLADPIRGNVRVPVPLFERQWQKNAVLVVAKREGKVPDYSRIAPRYSEVTRGWLNNQMIRQDPLTVKPMTQIRLIP